MPITIKPSANVAGTVSCYFHLQPAISAEHLFVQSCEKEHNRHFQKMLQSSFNNFEGRTIIPSGNGFVNSAIKAYNEHNNLIIRPEDVWFSLLSQLNFYILKHSNELRELFVDHDGKKELEALQSIPEYGLFAKLMTEKIAENIKNPSLREWIMPAFSTTTETDTVVAAILMMGMMQNYFSFTSRICCGLPSVRLLGEKEDWEILLKKLDFLPTLGEQPERFGKMLTPILKRFVQSFECPDSKEVKNFWQSISHWHPGGSGPSYISGWITAFCFWNKKGAVQLLESHPTHVLTLDDVTYGRINSTEIPQGYTSVPVTVDDNGIVFQAHMMAGSVAFEATVSGEESENCKVMDTLQPVSGWWMFATKDKDGDGEAD